LEDYSEEFDSFLFEHAFLGFEEQVVILQFSEDAVDALSMVE
jgi:hypothetical protein